MDKPPFWFKSNWVHVSKSVYLTHQLTFVLNPHAKSQTSKKRPDNWKETYLSLIGDEYIKLNKISVHERRTRCQTFWHLTSTSLTSVLYGERNALLPFPWPGRTSSHGTSPGKTVTIILYHEIHWLSYVTATVILSWSRDNHPLSDRNDSE